MNFIKQMPREIYIDGEREGCTIWTDTREIFSIRGNALETCNMIRNLVLHDIENEETGEVIVKQNIKVYIDRFPYYIGDCLKDMGVKFELIKDGSWLAEHMKIYRKSKVSYEDFMYFKNNMKE